MIGRTLGNYRIVEQIGLGGMATVYKAYDPNTDRYVAIKILPHQFSQDPTFRQRFEREAKAIAKLEHIHILPIFAYGEEEGTAYMAMRYLQAGTLTDRIRQGALPLSEAGRLLHQIAGALDHAHAHGVLHRDVKPSNVLLDADGNAFLTDFGIAKMVESTLDLTAGGILGTPAYMSPEQCQGSRELTPASDIFSLGIILYEMVTGRTPFQAETPIALIHMQLNEPMPPPCQLRPDLPEAGQRVILKALAREPESRYQRCEAMAEAFDRAIAQAVTERLQPVAAVPTADDSAMPTSPAIAEATLLHRAAPETAVVPVPLWRRLPGWVLALVGLVVMAGLVGGAIATGLISLGQAGLSPEARVSEAESEPTVPASETTGEAETGPVQPGEEATSIPPPLVNLGEPPTEGHEVVPCDWHGLGPGLCITPLEGDQPRKILTGAELEITSPGSWSPDGQRIAFSAVALGGRHDRDQTIHIVNVDGTDLIDVPTPRNDTYPAWSPDGAWLAVHSNGALAVMHPEGSMFAVIYEPAEGCVANPQWSPDSQSMVFYVIRDCEWNYPLTRDLWVVTTDGRTTTPIVSLTDENADCSWTEVAFSPDGLHVAYFDDQCQAWLTRADGSGPAERIADFPYWWTGMVHPQWGKVSVSQQGFFYEDFERTPLNLARWEPLEGARDRDAVFVEDGRLWIEKDAGAEPWKMLLRPKLLAPVGSIEFTLGVEEVRGNAIGFGAQFVAEATPMVWVWLTPDGAIVTEEEGQPIIDRRPGEGVPTEHVFHLQWAGDNVIIRVDEEPVGEVEVEGPIHEVGFWVLLEVEEALVGYLDDVRIAYLKPERPIPPLEAFSGLRTAEVCEAAESPQICIRDQETDQVTQITDHLEFGLLDPATWSPDGRQLIFSAGSDPEISGEYDHKLHVINADGSDLRQITHGDANDVAPVWSPDGQWVAFHRNCGLWLIRPNGSELQELVAGSEEFCVSSMAWTPNSRVIAFLNIHHDMAINRGIWIINREGTGQHLIHSFEQPVEWGMMAWSPDGQRIVCWYEALGNERGFLIKSDGSGELDRLESHEEMPWHWFPWNWPPWGVEKD